MTSLTNDSGCWKKCSICKKPILFNSSYYLCNISTCNRERTGMQFCSMSCWDAHLGYVSHRGEVFAKEERAPANLVNTVEEPSRQPVRKIIESENQISAKLDENKPIAFQANAISTDPLVVVSKVKKLISDQSGFNTSQCCIDRLTKKVVEEALKGIRKATMAGRKTVMGRDIE